MNQHKQYQQTLERTIDNATNIEQLTPYLKYIDFDKIKHRLIDTLHQEISENAHLRIKIYFSSISIVDILPLDVIKYFFRYFDAKDIFGNLFRVNKQFNQICKSKDIYPIRKCFYEHDLFSMWFLKEINSDNDEEEVYYDHEDSDAIYYLQNEYDSSTLNHFCKTPFHELCSILKGADWLIWRLCTIFKLNMRLLGNLISNYSGHSTELYANCFESLRGDYDSLEQCDEIERMNTYRICWPDDSDLQYVQGDIEVIARYSYRKSITLSISPVLLVAFPGKTWIQKFEKVLNNFGLLIDIDKEGI